MVTILKYVGPTFVLYQMTYLYIKAGRSKKIYPTFPYTKTYQLHGFQISPRANYVPIASV